MPECDLKVRTKDFALRIIRLYRALPHTADAYVIGKQLLRSGTSIGANYRSACRSRSRAEFSAKLGVVIEEADESLFWLELLNGSGIIPENKIAALMHECDELIAIFVAAQLRTKSKRN